MSWAGFIGAGCLAAAAVVLAWPVPGRRTRQRLVLGGGLPRRPDRSLRRRIEPIVARFRTVPGWTRRASGSSVGSAVVITGAAGATVLAGPVAGGAVAGYGVLAVRRIARWRRARSAARRRSIGLDILTSVAADLRAGLPVSQAWSELAPISDPVLAQVQAVAGLAERTGAPLADLIDRIEADARAADRANAGVLAQAAGARATAWLLAALPAGGLALGYAIGVDPLVVLLHTPIGAASAGGAIALQLAGLAWSDQLLRGFQ